ncbi:hypothetical protein AHF37_00266 [Paragonimus kellicotti]|nr:hypothetical protein AHF37_00266 [Paragonimus kellicotti]
MKQENRSATSDSCAPWFHDDATSKRQTDPTKCRNFRGSLETDWNTVDLFSASHHYLEHARCTQSLVPFQIIAYPDLVCAPGAPYIERFSDHNDASNRTSIGSKNPFPVSRSTSKLVGRDFSDGTEVTVLQPTTSSNPKDRRDLRVPAVDTGLKSQAKFQSERCTPAGNRCGSGYVIQPCTTISDKRVSRSTSNLQKFPIEKPLPRLPYSLHGLQHIQILDDVRRLVDPEDVLNRTVFDLDWLLLTVVREAQPDLQHMPRSSSPCCSHSPNLNMPGKPVIASTTDTDKTNFSLFESEESNNVNTATRIAHRTSPVSSSQPGSPDALRPLRTNNYLSSCLSSKQVARSVCVCAPEVGSERFGDCVITNEDEVFVNRFDPDKGHLDFESRFECGNLRKAIQIRQYEYDLVLSPDVNTVSNLQWFYFRVSNMEADVDYRFNIINCEKPNSQFASGMQPLLFSVREALEGRSYWRRAGKCLSYYRNHFIRAPHGKHVSDGNTYFTATFAIRFPHLGDVCYLAYHYPYTYTRLLTDITRWRQLSNSTASISEGTYFQVQTLTRTILDNPVPVITITQRIASEKMCNEQTWPPEKDKSYGRPDGAVSVPTPKSHSYESFVQRPYIFLTARVHSGESNSSWVLQGLIDRLLSNDPDMVRLRGMFVFKIVPMLNPDGVICGNHRCSMAGKDLNRRWINPSPDIHPTIYHSKKLLQLLHACGRQPYVFIDFHGHSRMKNIFLYGCSPLESWKSPDVHNPAYLGCPGPLENRAYRHLAEVLEQVAPTFSKKACMYVVNKAKETTARVAIWREFGVLRSYTIEASYCGVTQHVSLPMAVERQHDGNTELYDNGHQLNPAHLNAFGAHLLVAFLALPAYDAQHPSPEQSTAAQPSLFVCESDVIPSLAASVNNPDIGEVEQVVGPTTTNSHSDSSGDSVSTLSSDPSAFSLSSSSSVSSSDNTADS